LTSTNPFRRPLALLLAALLASTAQAVQNEYTLRASAMIPGARVLVDGVELKFSDESFVDPQPIEIRPEGAAGLIQAVLDVPDLGLTLVVNAAVLELQVREDGGLDVAIREWIESGGRLDVYHEQDSPAVRVLASGAEIGVGRGIVRLAARGEGLDVTAAQGQIAIQLPENRALQLTDGGENAVAIAAGGAADAARRVSDARVAVFADYQRLVQSSLLPDLVRVAEAVAEGDIEPPTRAAAVAAVAVAPLVQVREIVPRGGTVARVETGLQSALRSAPVQNLAESFIQGGEAALAVVGARLQRTRVVGAAGGARSPLSISPQVSRPFTIGR
jgi:hypothetical protein